MLRKKHEICVSFCDRDGLKIGHRIERLLSLKSSTALVEKRLARKMAASAFFEAGYGRGLAKTGSFLVPLDISTRVNFIERSDSEI